MLAMVEFFLDKDMSNNNNEYLLKSLEIYFNEINDANILCPSGV